MTHFLILLRNLRPKKVHGKPGQAVPLLPATKKTHPRASASQHYIQAELLPWKSIFGSIPAPVFRLSISPPCHSPARGSLSFPAVCAVMLPPWSRLFFGHASARRQCGSVPRQPAWEMMFFTRTFEKRRHLGTVF